MKLGLVDYFLVISLLVAKIIHFLNIRKYLHIQNLIMAGAHVTKLVPKLTPVEECVDVPKEVCQRKKGNPRTVFKPVTKTWCYTPTEESGLA